MKTEKKKSSSPVVDFKNFLKNKKDHLGDIAVIPFIQKDKAITKARRYFKRYGYRIVGSKTTNAYVYVKAVSYLKNPVIGRVSLNTGTVVVILNVNSCPVEITDGKYD